MQNNDENTRVITRVAHDQISTFLSHFSAPDATWDSFGKTDNYVERLLMHLDEMFLCVQQELSRRAVNQTDFGT